MKMKIRRYKKVNKSINFYINNFGFRHPYQILVDGTFCYAALNNKINISDNIPRYLQNEVKLLTTPCAIIEMENLGPKLGGALIVLKQFAVHTCGHEKHPVAASQCFLSMLGKDNTKHYIIATQDRDLQSKVRKIPAVPLLYLHSKTPVLDHPSEASIAKARERLFGLGKADKEALDELKQKSGVVEEDKPPKKKKKKGPNPLSCKKKKKKVGDSVIKKKEGKPEMEKKKRKRIRIPQHVKEELFKK